MKRIGYVVSMTLVSTVPLAVAASDGPDPLFTALVVVASLAKLGAVLAVVATAAVAVRRRRDRTAARAVLLKGGSIAVALATLGFAASSRFATQALSRVEFLASGYPSEEQANGVWDYEACSAFVKTVKRGARDDGRTCSFEVYGTRCPRYVGPGSNDMSFGINYGCATGGDSATYSFHSGYRCKSLPTAPDAQGCDAEEIR